MFVLSDSQIGTRTGSIKLPARLDTAFRLRAIVEQLTEVIDQHHPDVVAVESPFVKSNVRAALALGRAQAAAFIAAALRDRPVFEYAPREVKLAVAGDGNADKEVVAAALALELGLERGLELGVAAPPTLLDESDALAVAYCHYLLTRDKLLASDELLTRDQLKAAAE